MNDEQLSTLKRTELITAVGLAANPPSYADAHSFLCTHVKRVEGREHLTPRNWMDLKNTELVFLLAHHSAFDYITLEQVWQAIADNGTPETKPLPSKRKADKADRAETEAVIRTPEMPSEPATDSPAVSRPVAGSLDAMLLQLIEPRLQQAESSAERALQEVLLNAKDVRPEVKVVIHTDDGTTERTLPDTSHAALPQAIAVAGNRINLLLTGPAGSGKSTLAFQIAAALELDVASISFGPTTPTSKLFGFRDAGGTVHSTPFRKAYVEGGLFLADELDNGHPGLTAELNQALANQSAAFPDGNFDKHPDFVFIATANTSGHGADTTYVGRNALDGATLDRFITLRMDYDEALEEGMVMDTAMQLKYDTGKASKWLTTVRNVRTWVEDNNGKTIVSPRLAVQGVQLLATGAFTPDQVLASKLTDMSATDLKRAVES